MKAILLALCANTVHVLLVSLIIISLEPWFESGLVDLPAAVRRPSSPTLLRRPMTCFFDGAPISLNPLPSFIWACSLNLVKHMLQGLPDKGLVDTWKAVVRPDVTGPSQV